MRVRSVLKRAAMRGKSIIEVAVAPLTPAPRMRRLPILHSRFALRDFNQYWTVAIYWRVSFDCSPNRFAILQAFTVGPDQPTPKRPLKRTIKEKGRDLFAPLSNLHIFGSYFRRRIAARPPKPASRSKDEAGSGTADTFSAYSVVFPVLWFGLAALKLN